MSKPFKQIDVFTKTKFKGNPVAVFFQADDLTSEEMSQIANWTNLSETTFIQTPTDPSKADYKLRIFTPSSELPFAGHPTIGSCHALIEAGLIKPNTQGKIIQECKAGLVELNVNSDGKISFKLPYAKHTEFPDTKDFLKELGLSPNQVKRAVLVDDGPLWLTFELHSAQDVLNLKPNFSAIAKLSAASGPKFIDIDVFGRYHNSKELVYEARNFAPVDGINEDPVCGSGSGAIGSILAFQDGFTGEFKVKQGCKLGRDGELTVNIERNLAATTGFDIFVGGYAITCINGSY